MKNWVKPFLISEAEKEIDEFEKEHGTKKHFLKEILIDPLDGPYKETFIFNQLVECLNYHFGITGIMDNFFKEVFGSVLADLPEEVFKKLCGMSNVFYVYTPNKGAEVKFIDLETGIKAEDGLTIVVFPYIGFGTDSVTVLRGEIVHKLAHVFQEQRFNTLELDEQTDELATSWGFKKEVEAIRDYRKE